MLVAVMFLLAILVISMSIAAPIIKKQIQHDREIETMHRGKQYIRAIRMYYKKFGAYPPNIDALVKTNQIRFLRKKYIDPTTGKDEWKIIHVGQNKVPTAWGFFGQPLTGTTMAGTGPGGAVGLGQSALGQNGLNGNSGALGATGTGVSTTGSTDPNAPTGGSNGNNGSTDPNNPSGTDSGTGTNGTSGTTSPGAPGTGTGLSGTTFGGGGIIGVSPNSPKQSILVLHKKNHYNEWEFVYDPIAEQMLTQGGNTGLGGNGAGGTGVGVTGTGGNGAGGSGAGGTSGGSTGSTGGTGTGSGTSSSQPQQ
jgi:type II secretory pathway pseudopilin PulG